ncbi:WD repeat-containing protein 3 homolog isoform X1 [Pistacia vera]|uniref:WD repeat-containing protein 3 homolog isoform X1 n=1 Tax=Pistacia vera TaxID=55513 RepID=UPI0012633542|nr:WD repeat-containing protein 3 homolog isoform X1 [Pistacia vera]
MDSLKFFISLYGHKLPVLRMDISLDGDLIVTGTVDKNLKIWGLDFGDCHKSSFAHADSRADFIVTGSHDRSIRRWDRTEEPFFIEEEKEKRLEEMFESDLDNAIENRYAPKEELPEEGAVALAGKKTQETLTATDLIIEALDVVEEELDRIAQHEEEKTRGNVAEFQPDIRMLGLSPSDYVLRTLSNVNTNDLEQTLLALPFADALKLLSYLKDWASNPDKEKMIRAVRRNTSRGK